jgi:hypothetical protein
MKPIYSDIRREGRRWSHEEFDERISQSPDKIAYVNGIFAVLCYMEQPIIVPAGA